MEVRNKDGHVVLHYPLTIAHEPLVGETMREQLAFYNRLLPAAYSLAAVAIENSLVTGDEWESLPVYASPQDIAEAINFTLETEVNFSKNSAINIPYLENRQSSESGLEQTKVEIEIIEVSRFSEDEDSAPIPLVISLCRPA